MLKQFILTLIVLTPRHELNKKPELLDEVVGHFERAGEKYDIEPGLLAYWVYRESSFQVDVVGELGEKGFAQVHGLARSRCEDFGYNPETREGAIFCLAMLLDSGRRYCGDLEAGGRWYASGSCNRAKEKIGQRFKAYRRKWARLTKGAK